MAMRYVRIVQLWIHAGQAEAFEAFERAAARIMARHGGRIEVAVRMTPSPGAPFETHVVSFPDATAFEAYRADPLALALQGARDRVIARTNVLEGVEAGPYA